MKRVIFVCSGNICRSPMAAGIATKRFEELGVGAAVISCGTLNIQGKRADPHAVQAAAEHGIDLGAHRSQGVSVGLLRLADHIVVMEPKHADHVLRHAPELAAKVVRLWEHSDVPMAEIHDPIGSDLDAFRTCYTELEICIERWLQG